MFTIEEIDRAHEKVKTGSDFPAYIQEIKHLGVARFTTWVSDSHTDYEGIDGYKTQSGPQYSKLVIADSSDSEKFVRYLKTHQQGQTGYYTFCQHCAETGIEKWVVDLGGMTCTYYDKAKREILVEAIPQT